MQQKEKLRIVCGIHPVEAMLKSKLKVDKLFLLSSAQKSKFQNYNLSHHHFYPENYELWDFDVKTKICSKTFLKWYSQKIDKLYDKNMNKFANYLWHHATVTKNSLNRNFILVFAVIMGLVSGDNARYIFWYVMYVLGITMIFASTGIDPLILFLIMLCYC